MVDRVGQNASLVVGPSQGSYHSHCGKAWPPHSCRALLSNGCHTQVCQHTRAVRTKAVSC